MGWCAQTYISKHLQVLTPQGRCQYHSPCFYSHSAPHFLAHLDCPFMLQPTLSAEGASLKIYTAHRLMNQRETGGRGDEGGTETDERRGGREDSGRRDDASLWDVHEFPRFQVKRGDGSTKQREENTTEISVHVSAEIHF